MKQLFINGKQLNTYRKQPSGRGNHEHVEIQTLEFKETGEIITAHKDCPSLNTSIIKKIKHSGDQQNHKTNVKADMTLWDLQNDMNFKEICDFAIQTISEYSPNKLAVNECWGALYKISESCSPHAHAPHAWSFVYYAQATYDDAPLVFPTGNLAIHPYTGLLICFPSWVTHSVPPQESRTERIVVAGNMILSGESK